MCSQTCNFHSSADNDESFWCATRISEDGFIVEKKGDNVVMVWSIMEKRKTTWTNNITLEFMILLCNTIFVCHHALVMVMACQNHHQMHSPYHRMIHKPMGCGGMPGSELTVHYSNKAIIMGWTFAWWPSPSALRGHGVCRCDVCESRVYWRTISHTSPREKADTICEQKVAS